MPQNKTDTTLHVNPAPDPEKADAAEQAGICVMLAPSVLHGKDETTDFAHPNAPTSPFRE